MLATDRLKVIDRLTMVAPLGLRFWDEVSARIVGDGLNVTAYPADNPARRVEAFANRSGVYVLRSLPGMRAVENGAGDAGFWDNVPIRRMFIIEVIDLERRFQPFSMKVNLPERGVFAWQDPMGSSPPSPAIGVPLYSSPSRQAPPSLAIVRAELREWQPGTNHEGRPAAWAVLEARSSGRLLARGFADEQGRVGLIFPYPEPVTHTLGSPPASSPPAAAAPQLRDQEWTIEVVASYGRLHPAPVGDRPSLADLSDILTQPSASLWADSERGRALTEANLQFGRELVLRSRDFTASPIEGAPKSVLFITPAGSPP
jgi:hypothetical protein